MIIGLMPAVSVEQSKGCQPVFDDRVVLLRSESWTWHGRGLGTRGLTSTPPDDTSASTSEHRTVDVMLAAAVRVESRVEAVVDERCW